MTGCAALGTTASQRKRVVKLGIVTPDQSIVSAGNFVRQELALRTPGFSCRKFVLAIDQGALFAVVKEWMKKGTLLRLPKGDAKAEVSIRVVEMVINGSDFARKMGDALFSKFFTLSKKLKSDLDVAKLQGGGEDEGEWEISLDIYLDGQTVGVKSAAAVSRDRTLSITCFRALVSVYAKEYHELQLSASKLAGLLPVLEEATRHFVDRVRCAKAEGITARLVASRHEADEALDERSVAAVSKEEVVAVVGSDLDLANHRGLDVAFVKKDGELCVSTRTVDAVYAACRFWRGDFANFFGIGQGEVIRAFEAMPEQQAQREALTKNWISLHQAVRQRGIFVSYLLFYCSIYLSIYCSVLFYLQHY